MKFELNFNAHRRQQKIERSTLKFLFLVQYNVSRVVLRVSIIYVDCPYTSLGLHASKMRDLNHLSYYYPDWFCLTDRLFVFEKA